MANKDILDEIFGLKEEDAETFFDLVSKETKDKKPEWLGTEADTLQTKQTAMFMEQSHKFIKITHGYHDSNYVWHIAPSHPKKPWKVPMPKIFYAIGVVLNKHLPKSVIIDIYPPQVGWEMKEITIKANNVLDLWNVTKDDLAVVTGQLFEVLNELV